MIRGCANVRLDLKGHLLNLYSTTSLSAASYYYENMKKRIGIFSFIIGTVFLISGFAKSLDATQFSEIIAQYGYERMWFMSPIIILIELCLGLLFILQYRLRQTALSGLIFLITVTSIFLYGWLAKGMTDCGCFGRLHALNMSPWFTLIRNAAMFGLMMDIWSNSNRVEMQKDTLTAATFLLVMCIGSFISGYTSKGINKNYQIGYENEAIDKTKLKEFVETTPDSTYLVFVFSYTCPHCLNSIENLKQYEDAGIADRVIGLAIENQEAEKRFTAFFEPQFAIKNYPAKQLFRLSKEFPVAYYVRHDSIVATVQGELPTAYLLKK